MGVDMAPKMFINGEKSNAYKALELIGKASDGMPQNKLPTSGWERWRTRSYVSASLLSVGWIEERRTGPRGGKRYFITEMGRHVLDTLEKDGVQYMRALWAAYPEMLKEMKRMGQDPEEKF